MKIVLFSLLCLILIGITSYSYAQLTLVEEDTKLLHEVLLQLVVRDSNGSLIAYVEADQIMLIEPLALNRFLDNQNQTSTKFFIKDDKKYESHTWEVVGDQIKKQGAYSATKLWDVYQNEFVTLLHIRHDSFQTQPGDSVSIFWTVIRPAR